MANNNRFHLNRLRVSSSCVLILCILSWSSRNMSWVQDFSVAFFWTLKIIVCNVKRSSKLLSSIVNGNLTQYCPFCNRCILLHSVVVCILREMFLAGFFLVWQKFLGDRFLYLSELCNLSIKSRPEQVVVRWCFRFSLILPETILVSSSEEVRYPFAKRFYRHSSL